MCHTPPAERLIRYDRHVRHFFECVAPRFLEGERKCPWQAEKWTGRPLFSKVSSILLLLYHVVCYLARGLHLYYDILFQRMIPTRRARVKERTYGYQPPQ